MAFTAATVLCTALTLIPPAGRADEKLESAVDIPSAPTGVGQTSPLREGLADKKIAADAALVDVLQPAPVPRPPEQLTGEEDPLDFLIAPSSYPQSESEQAAIDATAPNRPLEFRSLRVLFDEDSVEIDKSAQLNLAWVAVYMNHNEAERVVLRAHAAQSDHGTSDGRRLSLSRALAVRAFLVEKGVPASRIALRPLGSEFKDGPPDRVDILPVDP